MNIWILSHLHESPGNRLITEQAEQRGHQVRLVRPHHITQALGSPLNDPPDLVFTRMGSSSPPAALAGLAVLEQVGLRCVNSLSGLRNSRDKTICYAMLSAAGVPIPPTVVLGDWGDGEFLKALKGPPWVVKLSVSTKGQGVCLVESVRSLRSVVDALRQEGESSILVQEFIAEAKGADIRVVVLGGKARVAARRQSGSADEFRSNLFLGGKADVLKMSDKMADIAERATRAVGLDVAGVDLLETSDGFFVVEVNGSPGLTAAPELPTTLMDYLEGQS